MRILVGMDMEQGLENKIREVITLSQNTGSNASQRDAMYQSIVNLATQTDYFDASEKKGARAVDIHNPRFGNVNWQDFINAVTEDTAFRASKVNSLKYNDNHIHLELPP